MKARLEALLATATTGGNWIVSTHEALQLVVTILTLLWWLRLWARRRDDPNDPKP